MSGPTLEVRVESVTYEAERINSYELRPIAGGALPVFKAGAHIDVHLQHDATRSYSLINPEGETHRYVIGVALDAASAGGSRFIHESVRPGHRLTISPPGRIRWMHDGIAGVRLERPLYPSQLGELIALDRGLAQARVA